MIFADACVNCESAIFGLIGVALGLAFWVMDRLFRARKFYRRGYSEGFDKAIKGDKK